MNTERVYRFELSFDNEPQNVGIFQGLNDTPVKPAVCDELIGLFDSLPVPNCIETPDGSDVVFWFREEGLKQFAPAINLIIQELADYSWEIIATSMPVGKGTFEYAHYKDAYQVAFSRSDVLEFTSLANFRAIRGIDITLRNPLLEN